MLERRPLDKRELLRKHGTCLPFSTICDLAHCLGVQTRLNFLHARSRMLFFKDVSGSDGGTTECGFFSG